MRKIIVLMLVVFFLGEMGCMLERRTPTTAFPESSDNGLRRSRNTEGVYSRSVQGIDTTARKHPSSHHSTAENQQRSIPSLQERLAKTGASDAVVIHQVQLGETLSGIAVAYYGSCGNDLIQALKQHNELQETDTVQAGWKLILPLQAAGAMIKAEQAMEKTDDTRPDAAWESASDGTATAANDASDGHVTEDMPVFKGAVMARFQEGVAAYENQQYAVAYNAFTAVSRAESRCETCIEYLAEIEARADTHFENGLAHFRKRNYTRAIQEMEKSRIPPLEPDATEYLFKSHFEIALKKFLHYKRTGDRGALVRAKASLRQARRYRDDCPGCMEYEEIFKKTHYNNGIKYFTGNDGESIDKAVQEWEKVHFIDPGYKDVTENILQAEALLKKLKKIKKVSQPEKQAPPGDANAGRRSITPVPGRS